MIEAGNPEYERERLEALHSSDLSRETRDTRLDRITRVAATVFGVPVAVVSVVEQDHVWFKSYVGLKAKKMPREVSFCDHAIQAKEALIVENTLAGC